MITALIGFLVPPILEAALRALLAAAAVWAGLRLLGVSNVLVQKTAWGLVLVAAVVMPLAPHGRAFPAFAALRLPALPLLSGSSSQVATPTIPTPQIAPAAAVEAAEPAPAVVSAPAPPHHGTKRATRRQAATQLDSGTASAIPATEFSAAAVDLYTRPESNVASHTAQPVSMPTSAASQAQPSPFRLATVAWLLYLGIFAALLLRILVGLSAAFRLWTTAEPILALEIADDAGNTPLRSSLRVTSPINIGSGILLPADYAEWDEQKLRVVLAHERSHIRQGDFYLQLLAGFYAACFWFSPLGWWLKRKLSELGEAISDRAGLEEAASRSSYAQLLLEFAALPRPTLTGVAMARSSHLTQRIERLLNESSFRQAFAAGGRRTLLAFLLVPAALFAATAMVRVEAAASPVIVAAPLGQITGQSTPEQVTEQAPAAAPAPMPESAPMPPSSGTMQAPPPPPPMGAADQAPMAPPPPMAGPDGALPPLPAQGVIPPMPPMPHVHVEIPRDAIHVRIDPVIRAEIAAAREEAKQYRGFTYMAHGEPYALVGDPGSKSRFNGAWDGNRSEEIEKARKVAHGHFLWFRHDGKSYVIDDPAAVAQIEAMNKPMDDLGKQMRELGQQMRAAGEQQRALGKQMHDVAIPTPDLTKAMDELNAAVASLKAKQGATISQKDLGDLQREMGKVQGELGALQGKIMMQQFKADGGMGKFGEQQGKFGSQMGQLGAQMGKLAHENQEKIQNVIDESLKNGKAKPVE